tara:strand:- start:962 stop:1189 length:228 start_codon:yes stop_codon:yes gene_type:complete
MLIPIINGSLVAILSSFITHDTGNRFLFAILAASASYIAVPKVNPGLFLPMALAITFPINITIGMPICFLIIQNT